MMRNATVALTFAATISVVGCMQADGPARRMPVPEPAKAVDLARYQGKWFEVARYEASFQRGCEAVTAEYAARPDGLVDVVNTCRQDRVDGPARFASAVARVIPDSGNAKLKVSFFWPFEGDYWVLNRADDYSWAIVGEPTGSYLWILSRTAPLSEAAYRTLTARAAALGYDVSRLRRTAHAAR